MATVETVTGPVEGKKLGFTLSHEHVGGQIPVVKHHYPWLVDRDAEREQSIRELSQAKAGGVDSLIELSTPDLERDVELMQEVSQATGVQIVCATGLWRVIPRYFHDRSADEMADVFRHEIEVGIGESGIPAGVIKVANDAEGVTEQGEKLLRAAARVSRQTRRPISTHHWRRRRWGGGRWRSFTKRARTWTASASATAPTQPMPTTWRICCERASTSRWTATRR